MSTLYVSRLGDDSDGRTWATALRSVQAALAAVPPGGGHTIVVRPDHYMEANLWPAHPGAPGAYNDLVGDVDGGLGSGTAGHVVLDSCDPQQGFKSYDWWGSVRSHQQGWSPEHTDASFSAVGWDRWRLRHLYTTGGDGGLMFDGVDRVQPFSVVVEDCVSIGRAFGGGVASVLSRPEEPITFRRCRLWALDWWGDTAAAYVRVHNAAMPETADVVFEDCTLVSPQCALKAGNYGFTVSSRVRVEGCKLFALNQSQPHGTPTDGIIQSVEDGRHLHVDLADTSLVGYQVFGVTVAKDTVDRIAYTTRGAVQACVQHTRDVPAGIHRLGHWPVDAFTDLTPPPAARPVPVLAERQTVADDLCELSPLVWKGRLCHLDCVRPGRGGRREDYCLLLTDAETGDELARFAEGHGLASALVHDGALHAFASRWSPEGWNDVTHFWSADLAHWESERVIEQDPGEQLFNTSVCAGPEGWVMAYESNDPAWPAFTVKFARSADLTSWQRDRGALFGADRYAACPCLRWVDGWYYMLYLERRAPRHVFETWIVRSRDLASWELSSANPVLRAEGLDEGINASDPELVEVDGKTWIYFAVGDQLTWMKVKRAAFDGDLASFCRSWFATPGIPDGRAGIRQS